MGDAIAEFRREPLKSLDPVPLAEVKAKTLVLYVYASADPEYEKNLLHFIREGVQVDFMIPLQISHPWTTHLKK